MEIKLRKKRFLLDCRTRVKEQIDNIIIKEDLINPDKEKVLLFFRSEDSSGVIEFSKPEIESLNRSLGGRINLVNGFKKIGRRK